MQHSIPLYLSPFLCLLNDCFSYISYSTSVILNLLQPQPVHHFPKLFTQSCTYAHTSRTRSRVLFLISSLPPPTLSFSSLLSHAANNLLHPLYSPPIPSPSPLLPFHSSPSPPFFSFYMYLFLAFPSPSLPFPLLSPTLSSSPLLTPPLPFLSFPFRVFSLNVINYPQTRWVAERSGEWWAAGGWRAGAGGRYVKGGGIGVGIYIRWVDVYKRWVGACC